MKYVKGDIFNLSNNQNTYIIIPTNLGWKKDGSNVMGQGLAKYASLKHPQLAKEYGLFCQRIAKQRMMSNSNYTDHNIFIYQDFILIPTKPLNDLYPHLSWKQNSSLSLINEILSDFIDFVYNKDCLYLFPLLGCGCGNLKREDVIPLMEKYFKDLDNIILVEKE